MKLKKRLLIILFSILSSIIVFSQNTTKNSFNSYSINVNGGTMIFYGDISDYDWYSTKSGELKFGYGISVKKSFNHVLGLQGYFLKGNLSASRNKEKLPASFSNSVYFNAELLEYGFSAIINFNNLAFPKDAKNRKCYVYGLIGAGLTSFRTIKKDITTDNILGFYGYSSDGSKKDMTAEAVFPIGLGLKFKISKAIDISIESSVRNLHSDKLDVEESINTSKDKYGYTSIGITYNFGKNDNSYDWVSPYQEMVKDKE